MVALPAPFLNGEPHEPAERVKDQPQSKSERECKGKTFEGERKSEHPVRKGGAHEFGIGVRARVRSIPVT
jgi:hypothetical protein